jgi:channel protein, hemolysin III family
MKKKGTALKKLESKGEEIANFVSHTVGAGLAILGFIMLIIRAAWFNNIPAIISYIVFSLGLMVLYTMSSIYHGLKPSKAKNVFEILDHSSIYFLIAASYTPFLVLGLKSSMSITLLIIQWVICALGITFKAFFTGKFKGISTIVYLIMGWMIVFSWNELISKVSPISIIFLVTGGILYSLGTIFYMWKVCKFNHMIWHIFVVLGSIAHYIAIWFLI